MKMRKAFETEVMRVMIEDMSYTGSAFGSNEKGDSVFFNQRLVDKISLEIGDIVEAHTIPNYEDKRHETPWRAIRVAVVGKEDPIALPPNRQEEEQIRIKDFLRDEGYAMTISELADHLTGIPEDVIEKYLIEDKNFTPVPAYTWVGD